MCSCDGLTIGAQVPKKSGFRWPDGLDGTRGESIQLLDERAEFCGWLSDAHGWSSPNGVNRIECPDATTKSIKYALGLLDHWARKNHSKPQRDQTKKSDAGKRPWELVPWGPLGRVVDVLAYGAGKYGARSWQSLDEPRERYSGALMRHAVAVMDGEWSDEESGLPHWAHVACNALFLLWFGDRDE